MQHFLIKSQGHVLTMRVVFYHGVGSQVFMDSFFVTGVDPKAVISGLNIVIFLTE